MMKIAICDDESKILEDIKQVVLKQLDAQVFTFGSGEELLEATKMQQFDVALLDIDMPGMSGMDVAAALTESKAKTLIVFVTAHDELVYDSFKYHPFAFVRKNYLEKELIRTLEDCSKEIENLDKHFVFKADGKTVNLTLEDILYFEAESNYLVIHLADDVFRMRSTMTAVENDLLAAGFIRIHKGFLVNLEHIRLFNMEELTLDNKEKLPMGKAYAGAARTEILRYMGR